MTPVRAGASARSLAGNVLAAALMTPVVLSALFFLLVSGVATGGVFRGLAIMHRALPDDPDRAALLLAATVLGGLGLLLVACFRHPWLMPALLLLLGASAEAYVLAVVGWGDGADPAIPALGGLGIALSAMQLRNAL